MGKIDSREYLSSLIGKEVLSIVEKRRLIDLRAVSENFVHIKVSNSDEFKDLNLGGKRVFIKITELCNSFSQTEAPEVVGIITKIV